MCIRDRARAVEALEGECFNFASHNGHPALNGARVPVHCLDIFQGNIKLAVILFPYVKLSFHFFSAILFIDARGNHAGWIGSIRDDIVRPDPVSYTHIDVYKRQCQTFTSRMPS